MADTDTPGVSPQELKGVYRYQVDVIVLANSQDEADKMITYKQPGFLRGLTWTVIRNPKDGWVNPAWRVEQDGDWVTVEPRRKRKAR